ncbi:hypothetical protein MSG28_005470 [Choristoneura fumiferana]|uniref:Uncharacterized protein n=1 Tax=Choristoneura fumiferana TaxID=7141 RepID=A0ACC0KZ10_CHOFU|nr:hypothetical protein MSG28_005470 [Choristoneura fumiferana]
MTKRTVVNEVYKGLLESVAIPAELRERDGKRFATFGAVVPIHCCTEEEVRELVRDRSTTAGAQSPSSHVSVWVWVWQVPEWSRKTHHYCGIFTEDTLAPLGELAYVRVDENTAEKVFINRAKRMLVRSADGVLAQWRCAPSFESSNQYLPGTPIVNQDGALVSVVTVRKGNHYAVSTFEASVVLFLQQSDYPLSPISSDGRCTGSVTTFTLGLKSQRPAGEGGYFDTSLPWQVLDSPGLIYGAHSFPSRAALREHVGAAPAHSAPPAPATPVLHRAPRAPYSASRCQWETGRTYLSAGARSKIILKRFIYTSSHSTSLVETPERSEAR